MFGTEKDFESLVKAYSGAGNSSVYVVLHSTNGVAGSDRDAPVCEEAFEVAKDLWICRISNALRDAVYDACESPGSPPIRPHRQYGQLYTLALFNGPWAPGQVRGDRDAELNTLLSLSQLVHQTTLGFANSARLDFDPEGDLIEAIPHACRGVTEQAFMVADERNWLARDEAVKVRDLYAIGFGGLPDKVKRANWHLQHAFFQYFFEIRSLLMVTGLEALVHARVPLAAGQRSAGTTKQFIERTTKLAEMLGVPFTCDDARYVYEHRSDVAHGRDPWSARLDPRDRQEQVVLSESVEVVRMYLKAERLLRSTIIRCITDQAFSSIFQTDASVAAALPVS